MSVKRKEKFFAFAEEQLGKSLNKSGALLYSSANTLKKGRFLIMGLNPGGDPKSNKTTIKQSIKECQDPGYNAYLEDWSKNEDNGKHKLQENLKALSKQIKVDLKKICATNMIFTRSKDASQIKMTKAESEAYANIHEEIFKIVSPEVVFTFGKEPFNRLAKFYAEQDLKVKKLRSKKAGHANWTIDSFVTSNGIKVIGFPHLSRYSLHSKKDILEWVAKNVN